MKTRPVLFLLLLFAGVVLLWSQMPVAASPDLQVAYPSPTPGPDGRIIYKVKAGETCIQISLLYGVSVEYIRTSNLLDESCTLREGQDLMIGIGGPSDPTPTTNPDATAVPPTPTTIPEVGGTAVLCVLVFDDANGDALRQEVEPAIPGAAISLTSVDGTYSQTQTSVLNPNENLPPEQAEALDPYEDPPAGMCFFNLPPGKYNISAAAPDGYNPTIELSASVEVIPGDIASVNFGAQARAESAPAAPDQSPSPLLGIAGAAFLLTGIGLGAYTWRLIRKK